MRAAPTRIRTLTVGLVLALALAALAWSTGGASASKAITGKQVRKIATRIADHEIDAKAATLSVAKAKSADTATTATNATHASSADTLGTTSAKTFATEVLSGGATKTLATVNGLTVTLRCPAGLPWIEAKASPAGPYEFSALSPNGANPPVVVVSGGASLGGSATPVNAIGFAEGTGTLTFAPNTPNGTSVSYGWRSDSGNCQAFGTIIGG
jgi:hypothetical protein